MFYTMLSHYSHTCPKDLVSYRNISNILEEALICQTNWNLAG